MVAICIVLAVIAAISIASPDGMTNVRLWVVARPFVGAALVGFGKIHRWKWLELTTDRICVLQQPILPNPHYGINLTI